MIKTLVPVTLVVWGALFLKWWIGLKTGTPFNPGPGVTVSTDADPRGETASMYLWMGFHYLIPAILIGLVVTVVIRFWLSQRVDASERVEIPHG